ncbi:serine-rich adhesin for platelets isoform X2 [Topomyia yanbarensis]|uniref:serine-rich adhesin for platelets isoform X2 n=1 Tax=Topomyia yanbarensis TaxID=2498891 RepID=UPI00273BFA8A|nr:serine-rich adhesin for platelets isoform X2 [Topomyia yanbarensis]
MDIIDVDEVLGDDSFIGDTERLDDEVVEILKQWKSCGTLSSCSAVPAASSSSFGFTSTSHHLSKSQNSSLNHDSKGSKYIDTRTFTRPKKKVDTTFNSPNASAEFPPAIRELSLKALSPLLNLQIGGLVTQTRNSQDNSSPMLQRSWLGDVSPPGSIMSSMEFSVNDKMGTSLITSGDFSNVSYLLNGANGCDEMLNSQSNYDGYKLADVIKDRHFLESLSCFDDNTLTKDSAISKTDLNGIDENMSGFSTMQNSLESVTKSTDARLSDVTMALGSGIADEIFELEPKEKVAPVIKGKLNGTFERRRNFDTYRKPKSSLNGTMDALPTVDGEEPMCPNRTFDADSAGAKHLDATFEVPDNCNGTFSLNRTANVNGTEKQLNQTYDYCEKASTKDSATDQTFVQPKDQTFVDEPISPEDVSINVHRTPNGTFDLPLDKGEKPDTVAIIQSTPFVRATRASRGSDICQVEENISPIALHSIRRSGGIRRSRNLENEMSSHVETDDFDVEFSKLPITPSNKTDSSNGSHLLDNEKRISLQHFEDFEKSIMESEHNGVDFDEMLNSLTDVKRSMDSVKMRQSLDNIKKRHSRMNSEKQQEDLRKRTEVNDSLSSPLDNKLADSMAKSMSSSSGSERLLNRRSRYNDDVHLTLSPQQLQKGIDISENDLEHTPTNETETSENVNPLPTAPEVGSSDKKNRDRFKTIRINKRLIEGMVVVPSSEEVESAFLSLEEEVSGSTAATRATVPSAFSRIDYNSPKESRFSTSIPTDLSKTEDIVFKRPQEITIPENKTRSLSKPRYYGGPSSSFGLAKKDMSLPLAIKSSSTDNLENDRPNYQQSPINQPSRLSIGGKVGSGFSGGSKEGNTVQSNLKSPMGTKSKSYHNLYFNQSSHGGSNNNLHRGPTPLGLSAQKMSHNNSNTELSGVQMRAPKTNSRLGLIRPSSGYFSYGLHKKNADSDTESINSLSSSSASSRGSLYRADSQSLANNVQTGISIDDMSGAMGVHSFSSLAPKSSVLIESKRTAVNATKLSLAAGGPSAKPSGLRQPSNLRPPTVRSALPRPTSYVKR